MPAVPHDDLTRVSAATDRRPGPDRAAEFEALFRTHYGPVCRFLDSVVQSRDVAEELAQDVFLRMWEMLDAAGVVPITPAYLFGAAHNRALQYLRHQRVIARSAARVVSAFDAAPVTPFDELAQHDLAAAIDRAVAELPERCRLVFVLSRQQHLGYTEIAQALGVSVRTVETQMWRALKRLRARLAPFLAIAVMTASGSEPARASTHGAHAPIVAASARSVR